MMSSRSWAVNPRYRRARTRRQPSDESEQHLSPMAGVSLLSKPHGDQATRARAIVSLHRTLGNAWVQRQVALARCACGQTGEDREPVQRDISTPLDPDVTIRKDGAAVLTVADVVIIVKPDIKSKNKKLKGAKTTFSMVRKKPVAKFTGKKGERTLLSLVPPKITVTIRTIYGPKVDPLDQSAYGKGTSAEDIEAGNTSLQYHEGSHGLDYIQYIQENPPQLMAEVGMSEEDYKVALAEFNKLMKTYAKEMDKFSTERTDCVGTTIDEAGFTKKPICE